MFQFKFKNVEYSFVRQTEFNSRARELLYKTIWGTSEVKYRQMDIANAVVPLGENIDVEHYYVVPLADTKIVIASYLLFSKKLNIDQEKIKVFYGSQLSVDPKHSGQGLGKIILNGAIESSRLHNPAPRLDYAYVETTNVNSYKLFKSLGYENLGTFHVPSFSRTFTKSDPRVIRLPFQERAAMVELLNKFYHGHVLTDFEFSLNLNFYAVIKNHFGEIIAGAQYVPHHWYLESLAGIDGWFSIHLAPWIPFLGRQIKRDMHFVRFGNLYVKEGSEKDLCSLLVHLLNLNQVHTGTIYIDHRSSIYTKLKNIGLGIVNSLAGENPVELMIHPVGVDKSVRDRIKEGPIHISLLDA